MKAEEHEQRQDQAKEEIFIISRTGDGFRVYSPDKPGKSYTVSGSADPSCTCEEYQYPEWRCKHIAAVLQQFGKVETQGAEDDYARREREAIQCENDDDLPDGSGASQMLIKRSVSPDGKIDSLSVEFSMPVDLAERDQVHEQAVGALKLQAEITHGFLSENGKHHTEPARAAKPANDGSVPAQMTDVGGMNGRYGRRLFINVEVDGQRSKIFGTQKQLEEAIEDAGFTGFGGRVAEGFTLNLPCRAVTKPSQDGRYINIEKVLPIDALRVKEGAPKQ